MTTVGQMNLDDVKAAAHSGNRPERVAWFRDLGLGLFIHWSVDVQLGMVISHSLVGASADYTRRFFTELPQTFCPARFDPDEWARLAKVCGFRYVVFTTKHHSGFCMFETATTDFGVMHTPFGRDITREVVEAFRRQGIAIGLYFSPDDFSVLHRQGIEIARSRPEVDPLNNPELMAVNLAQLRELLNLTPLMGRRLIARPIYRRADWVLEFANTGAADTPILEDILPLDLTLPAEHKERLRLPNAHGRLGRPNDFLPPTTALRVGQPFSFAPPEAAGIQ